MGYGFHSTARKAGVSPSTVKRYIRELKDLL
jgi:DNA-binding LacI/PurR family transcriptional regulator